MSRATGAGPGAAVPADGAEDKNRGAAAANGSAAAAAGAGAAANEGDWRAAALAKAHESYLSMEANNKAAVLRKCGNSACTKMEASAAKQDRFQQCARCKKVSNGLVERLFIAFQVVYCSADCQRAHWKSHKTICKA